MPAQMHHLTELDDETQAIVRSLAAAATEADGVAPLSEQVLLSLPTSDPAVVHVLPMAMLDETDGVVAGYAQIDRRGQQASAELVIHPMLRRAGAGGALLRAVLESDPAVRVWAHGDLPAAQALAASAGMTAVRELWRMHRPLDDVDPTPDSGPDGTGGTAAPELPADVRLHTLGDGDEERLLAVNARAFASHPEQGRMSLADLDARRAEAWFEADDVLLAEDAGTGELLAFLWLKVQPGDPDGELYVLGVDPAAQGRGLGRALTGVALRHLRERGCTGVTLYVDGDNTAAVRTYTAAGFTRAALDVQYARP